MFLDQKGKLNFHYMPHVCYVIFCSIKKHKLLYVLAAGYEFDSLFNLSNCKEIRVILLKCNYEFV